MSRPVNWLTVGLKEYRISEYEERLLELGVQDPLDLKDIKQDDLCGITVVQWRRFEQFCSAGGSGPPSSATAVHPGSTNPVERFLALLPAERKPVDPETLSIVQRLFGSWLQVLYTENDAVELLETASRQIHASTKYRIKKNSGLLLDGIFEQNDSASADLSRAFDVTTLAPKVIKFGEGTYIEYLIFSRLNLSDDDATANHLVPMRYIRDGEGKQGVVMPCYACSLSSVDCNFKEDLDAVQLEDAFLRGTLQIQSALSTLHAKGVIHNDIKPGNILIDFNGGWHLADYGSCTCDGIQSRAKVKYTGYYCPTDFNKQQKVSRNSPEFDEMLLAVSVLDRLQLLTLQHGFTCWQLVDSVGKVVNEEFKALLRDMIAF